MPNKRSPWMGIIILLVIVGLIATYSSFFSGARNSSNNSAVQNNPSAAPSQTVQYQGKDGVDALTLLKENHTVDASDQGFVNSIDGVKPAEKQYWALYVNGQLSMTGAKDTVTKSGDTIEWKLVGY